MSKHAKLLILEFIILIISFFIAFIPDASVNNPYFSLIWVIIFLCTITFFEFEKDKQFYKKGSLSIIFMYSMTFIMVTYFLGLLFGFEIEKYDLSNLILNLMPLVILISMQELVRYIIVSKGEDKKILIILMVILFTFIDIDVGLNAYISIGSLGIFEIVGLFILPILVKNLLFTFIILESGYRPVILYRLIVELPIFILPIFPNMSIHFYSLLNIIFPTIMFIRFNNFIIKNETFENQKFEIKNFLFWSLNFLIVSITIVLASGIFKFHAFSIASGSMSPEINTGDAIVIEKIKGKELEKLDVGDIIAYRHDEKVIVHRIVEIKKVLNKDVYITKGDANNGKDNYIVLQSDVVGIVRFNIPYVGYPSIWLTKIKNK